MRTSVTWTLIAALSSSWACRYDTELAERADAASCDASQLDGAGLDVSQADGAGSGGGTRDAPSSGTWARRLDHPLTSIPSVALDPAGRTLELVPQE